MPFSYTIFQKISLPWEGENPLPHPPPSRSGFAPLLWPPLPFSYTNFQKKNLPTTSHTLLPLGHFAPLLWPPLTHPGCTTVTGIAKMHKGPWSPLIGVKEVFKRGNIYGIGTYATSHNYPLIMSFSVEENAVFIHKFSKNLPTVGGGTPPSHTLPPSLARSLGLGRFAPSHITAPPKMKSWLANFKVTSSPDPEVEQSTYV